MNCPRHEDTKLLKGRNGYYCPKKLESGKYCDYTSPEPPVSRETKVDWNALAIGKTASLFMAALLQSGMSVDVARLELDPIIELATDLVNKTNGEKDIY